MATTAYEHDADGKLTLFFSIKFIAFVYFIRNFAAYY